VFDQFTHPLALRLWAAAGLSLQERQAQHAAAIRAEAADGLGFLGVGIDHHRNADLTGDRELTATGNRVHSLVVAAGEDLEIARQVQELLISSSSPSKRKADR
jgi:hypothetical protein